MRRRNVPYQVQYLCPDAPWFCELEKKVEHMKRILSGLDASGKYEVEARIGTLHPETRQFVPGLTQKDGERLLSQACPKGEIWEKLNDVLYPEGVRRRNGGLLVKKKTLYSATFLTENGFAFRLSLASEEELPKNYQTGPEVMRRHRARWSRKEDADKFRYDFTFNYDSKHMEVEIESLQTKPNIWELAYRVCSLARALRPTSSDTDLQLGWPLACF